MSGYRCIVLQILCRLQTQHGFLETCELCHYHDRLRLYDEWLHFVVKWSEISVNMTQVFTFSMSPVALQWNRQYCCLSVPRKKTKKSLKQTTCRRSTFTAFPVETRGCRSTTISVCFTQTKTLKIQRTNYIIPESHLAQSLLILSIRL